jgi:hypothetical protein
MTVTEGLAEIKTLLKRIEAKRKFILDHVGRLGQYKDPFEQDGGAVSIIKRERQAFKDLLQRIVRIRVAIQAQNRATSLTVEGMTLTVAEWLAWRKDAAPQIQALLTGLCNGVAELKTETLQSTYRNSAQNAGAGSENFVLHLSETDLAKETENFQQVIGVLDGQLSLLNATTMITVPD